MFKQRKTGKVIVPYVLHGARGGVQNEESTEKLWWMEDRRTPAGVYWRFKNDPRNEPEEPAITPTAEARRLQAEGYRLQAQGRRPSDNADRKTDDPELAEADDNAIRRSVGGW
jgi:hypothetical protein